MQLLDVRPDHLTIVQDILKKHVPAHNVWAFGSRAKWLAKEYSDLDLCIVGETPLSFTTLGLLKEAFEESDLPWRVDVVDWATTSESFRKIIERDKVVVQSGKSLGTVSEWQEIQLEKVCLKIGSGATPRGGKDAYRGGETALIRSQNIHNDRFTRDGLVYINDFQAHELRNVVVEENDVLLNITGDSVARCCQVDPDVLPARVNQHVAIIRTNPKILDSRFLRYVLVSPSVQDYLLALASAGATRNALTKAMVESLTVKAPPIKEQRAIAHILGTLDDKIELNRQQNETLEAMARALFKAWFVDFEPVRAKMQGRWQRGQSLPGLPAHLYDLFPDRLVESELGEIPEGWRMGSLGEVAAHPRRGVQPGEIKDETPYIALEHMPKRCIALAEWGTANGLESNKYEFKQGEILFGKLRPYFHKVGVAPVDGVCSTDIVVIAPKLPIWFGFVLTHASSDAFVEYTNAGSTGTKMPRTSWTEMARYAVVLPHEDVATAFNQHIQAASEEISAKIHESKSLAQLRDTLLPKLISGELRVSDAEAFLKERV
jgi:type I restriction enzyme, S subunit